MIWLATVQEAPVGFSRFLSGAEQESDEEALAGHTDWSL